MKKTITIFALCLFLLCITACNDNDTFENTAKFASSEEMLNHLAGMWVADTETEEKSYYIFQDGQIYNVTDTTYSTQVKKLLDSALQNGGLDVLYNQDFANMSKRMYLSEMSINTNPVTLFPQDGVIKLNKESLMEKSIVVTEDAVLLVPKDAENGIALTKLSDAADFSTDHFEQLFNQVIDNYQVPTKYFLMDTAEYGEIIKSTISNFDWWNLIWSDDEVQAYSPNEALTTINGSNLTITKEALTYAYKVNVPTGFSGKDYDQLFTINYRPKDGEFEAIMVNVPFSNLNSLITYGLCAIQNIPGAYSDPDELYLNMTIRGDETETKLTLKDNGIEYFLDKNETFMQFKIKVNDTILLKQTQDIAEENKNDTPLQSGTLDQLLDGSKSWVGKWTYASWEYNVFFVFKEDGTCYWALAELELFGAGVGTYSIQDGNTLQLELMELGKKHTDIYTFDPDSFSLTIVSAESFAANQGEVLYLQENTEIDTEQIESWGNLYSKASPESEEWE